MAENKKKTTQKKTNNKTSNSKSNVTSRNKTTTVSKNKKETKKVVKKDIQKKDKKLKVEKKVVEKKSLKEKINDMISSIKEKFSRKKEKTKPTNKQNNKSKKNNKKINNSKKNKKKSTKTSFLTKNPKKTFIILAIICGSIILLEGIFVIIHKKNIDSKNIYYDAINSIAIDDRDTVAVGSSNFRYSKYYSHTKGLEKGKIIKYDKNGKIIFEKMYEKGINTTFSSVITIEDGYIVVGSGVFSKEEQEQEAREAFIIKYDKKGNIVWQKFYQVVTNTRFNKVIETSDGYVAIGQSIYANMELGNHTTGGGIIVKYDKEGNEVWHENHGGIKSGNFNDVVEVDGNFYVVGKDATDSANIVKFDKDGKYVWHKNYSYTDKIGFTGIAYLDNSLYVVGSKKILPDDYKDGDSRDTTNTDALLIVYDLEGNKKIEKTFGGSNYERYNSIMAYHNNLYVVGHTSSKDAGFKLETDGELMTGLVVRYDKDGNILKKDILGGSNNDNLTDITTDGISIFISGYSNSADGNITTAKNNGKDYFGKVIRIDFKFRTLLVK